MSHVIIDTNVAVVANGRAQQASADCMLACIDALEMARNQMVIVLDSLFEILNEYIANLSFSGQPGVGDAFFKWLWENQANREHVAIVTIHPKNDGSGDFEEFPQDADLVAFDRSDRKFVAVCLADPEHPPILNAVDSDWWNYRFVLERHGVRVEFVCPDQFE